MTEFRIGDEVILIPPIHMKCEYIPWVGRYAKVLKRVRTKDGAEWYKIEVNGGEVVSTSAEWLKPLEDEIISR